MTGVVTNRGEIESEYVVNCAGMWAREIGEMAGVVVPLQAAEHYYGEVIWRNDERVGYIRVGAYGHTLGAAVGLGFVEAGEPVEKSYVESGKWEIEIAGARYAARASLRPMYDPQLKRVKGE